MTAMRRLLYYLELREPFGISRSTFSKSDTVFVNIDGGWGEATSSGFFGENEHTVMERLDAIAAMADLPDPDLTESVADAVAERIAGFGAAKAAVDIALHDRLATRLGLPLHRLFGRAWRPAVTSYTIGIAEPAEMLRKVREVPGFRILKVKLGRDVERDIAVMRQIRREVGDGRVLRIDANGGWSFDDAARAVDALADLGVEYVEQPLARGSLDAMRRLRARSPLPLYADEDIVTGADVVRWAGACDGINIKLMKCGGLTEARRMLALARAHGLKVMLGGRIESSVGVTAAAHLAPWADSLDLDGMLLVTNDPFEGVQCDGNGNLTLPDRPGLGVRLRDDFAGVFAGILDR